MRIKRAFALALACLSLPSFAIEADFNATSWGNNGPYALANLKNKLVVLYFFEEG